MIIWHITKQSKDTGVFVFLLFAYVFSSAAQTSNLRYSIPVAFKHVLTIGDKKGFPLLYATDVVPLSTGDIIVSDKLDYCLKEFDQEGRLYVYH